MVPRIGAMVFLLQSLVGAMRTRNHLDRLHTRSDHVAIPRRGDEDLIDGTFSGKQDVSLQSLVGAMRTGVVAGLAMCAALLQSLVGAMRTSMLVPTRKWCSRCNPS